MSTLTVVLTHQDAPQADERMALLQAVAPDARFVVGHGGSRAGFEALGFGAKFFVEDPTLRGPAQHLQSLDEVFSIAWRDHVAADPDIDSVYVIEYDHLILDPAFERRLRDVAEASDAGLLGKSCIDATGTNLPHYVRFRRDPRLLAQLERVSVREDRTRLFATLGDGIWLRRDALEAYVNAAPHPPCYCEIYVPTLVHHLGFRVVDVDAHSDLYHDVRWQPERSAAEVLELARGGAVFVHPAKEQAAIAPLQDLVRGRRSASPAA